MHDDDILDFDFVDDETRELAPPSKPSGTRPPGGGPSGGVTAFVLATAVVAAFIGGIGVSAFALRRRTAT